MSSRMVSRAAAGTLDLAQPARRRAPAPRRRRCSRPDSDRRRGSVPPSSQLLDRRLPLVAVGDVEQLHHVGAVVALALTARARSPRRSRSRSRETTTSRHLAAAPLEPVAQQLGLGLLAALVEAFERDQQSALMRLRSPARSSDRSSIVWRRRITARLPAFDQHFGRQRTAIVVRRHRRAVGAGVADGDEIADLRPRQHAVAAERVAALADRADDLADGSARRRGDRLDAVKGVVERRAASARSCRRR